MDKVEKGLDCKARGNDALKANDITGALRSYHEAILYLSGLPTAENSNLMPGVAHGKKPILDQEISERVQEALRACYLNMAVCHLKQQKWDRCIETCTTVLQTLFKKSSAPIEPSSVYASAATKAYFRRAKAYLEGKNDLDKSTKDVDEALKLAPHDAEIVKLKRVLLEKEREYTLKQKRDMAGIFNR